MTRVKSIVTFFALSWSSPALAQPPPATFAVDGEAVTLQSTTLPVHIPACRGLIWELRDPDTGRYRPFATAACPPSQPAVLIDRQGLRFEPPADIPRPGQARVTALIGVGCRPDRPFPIAGCRSVVSVFSEPISLGPDAP
ncbi:MAG: hypothetical protein AAFV53_17930 [Myxococcota bacterium]